MSILIDKRRRDQKSARKISFLVFEKCVVEKLEIDHENLDLDKVNIQKVG